MPLSLYHVQTLDLMAAVDFVRRVAVISQNGVSWYITKKKVKKSSCKELLPSLKTVCLSTK
jgi:hypothetical protein